MWIFMIIAILCWLCVLAYSNRFLFLVNNFSAGNLKQLKNTTHTQTAVPRISLNFNYRDRENKTWIEDLKSKHHFPYHLDDVLSVKFVCVFLFLRLVALLDLCGWSIWAYCMPKYTHSLQFSCGNFFIVDVRMK